MIKDIFGTPIEVGRVILVSKGDRGHKNFSKGIVTEIVTTPKQIWIKFTLAYKPWNQRKNPKAISSLSEEKCLAVDDFNKNIVVVLDVAEREFISQTFTAGVDLLKASGKFPADYVIGEVILSKKEQDEEEGRVAEAILEALDSELLSSMDIPDSLKIGK